MATSGASNHQLNSIEIDVNEYKSSEQLTKLANGIENAKSKMILCLVDPNTGLSAKYQVSHSYTAQSYDCDISKKFTELFDTKGHNPLNNVNGVVTNPMYEASDVQQFDDNWGNKFKANAALNEMVTELNNVGRYRAFWQAATEGNVGMLSQLLADGVSIDRRDFDTGETALLKAVNHSKYQCAKILLEHDASAYRSDHKGNAPIDTAVVRRDAAMVELLLKHGASLRMSDQCGEYVFHKACKSGSGDILRSFLSRDAQLAKFETKRGASPLLLACENGNEEAVRALLEYGADVSKADDSGNLPLHTAVERGDLSIVRALVNSGANPRQVDHRGRDALTLARNYQYKKDKADLVAAVVQLQVSDKTLNEWEVVDFNSIEEPPKVTKETGKKKR